MNIRENSKITWISLQKRQNVDIHSVFKDTMDVKGAQRSIFNWASSIHKVFFKKFMSYVNARPSKIRSIHTYVEQTQNKNDLVWSTTKLISKLVRFFVHRIDE